MKRLLLNDRGYATVASVGIIVALVSLLLVIAAAVQHVASVQRARVFADLAAVSAATALYEGHDACEVAGRTAELNGAALKACEELGSDMVVTVRSGSAESTARAGPL